MVAGEGVAAAAHEQNGKGAGGWVARGPGRAAARRTFPDVPTSRVHGPAGTLIAGDGSGAGVPDCGAERGAGPGDRSSKEMGHGGHGDGAAGAGRGPGVKGSQLGRRRGPARRLQGWPRRAEVRASRRKERLGASGLACQHRELIPPI